MRGHGPLADAGGTSRQAPDTPDWLPRLAHDLRSPLAPLRIAGQMLQIGEVPFAELRELGRTIGRQTLLLQELVDDLGDVMRIGQGAFRVNLQPCDLGAAVAYAVAETSRRSRSLGRACRAVVVRPTAIPLTVAADELALIRLIVQVIGAIAPTADSEGGCWIGCERTADMAIVRIHDDARRIFRSAGIEYIANGRLPEDPGILAMAAVIGREIALAHSAVLGIGDAPEGPIAEMTLTMPLAGAASH